MFVVLCGLVRAGSQHFWRGVKIASPVEQRAAGWLCLIKKAMNGMRTASKEFADLVAEVMKEIQFERGKAHPQIHKHTKSQAAIVFHVDDPILASSHHQQTARVWKRIGEHAFESARSNDTRQTNQIPHQTVRESAHTRQTRFKVRLPQETSTASQQQWKWSVPGHELSQRAGNLDKQWDKLAKSR